MLPGKLPISEGLFGSLMKLGAQDEPLRGDSQHPFGSETTIILNLYAHICIVGPPRSGVCPRVTNADRRPLERALAFPVRIPRTSAKT